MMNPQHEVVEVGGVRCHSFLQGGQLVKYFEYPDGKIIYPDNEDTLKDERALFPRIKSEPDANKRYIRLTGVIPFFMLIMTTPSEYCYRIPLELTCNTQLQTSTLL